MEGPMTEEHKKIITKHQDELASCLRVDSLLNKLVAESIITDDEHEDILEERPRRRAGATLRLMKKGKDKGFYILIESCRKSAQEHLATILEDEEKPKPKPQPPPPSRPDVVDSSGYESDEGFDVSDTAFDVKVKPTTEAFYMEHRGSQVYPMYKPNRGKALIINVNEVKGLPPRKGTDVDRDNLVQLFQGLHFDVTVYNDSDGLTAEEIKQKVRDFASPENHQDSQCAAMAVLSHGEEGYVVGTDKEKVSVDQLRRFLASKNCSSLIGKPKLSLIQACRGTMADDGVDYPMDEADDLMADFGDEIVGFPTKAGFKSWRNQTTGSFFISAVVKVFQDHAHHEHVADMLTRVNAVVRRKITNPLVYEAAKNTQMCETHTTLGKKWYLFPGITKDSY